MKTAMQELMDWFYNRPEYDKSSEGYEIMTMCEILLNVEKEQIEQTFENGVYHARYFREDEEQLDGEDYYNRTYNQNK
jgi:hypothetical protein